MPRRFLSLIPCLIAMNSLSGQAPPAANTALLHINQPFYVTGEVIWYQLYLPPGLQGQAFTVQATIVDEQGQAVDDSFISSRGEPFCQGYLAIPYELPSGAYRLWLTAAGEKEAAQTLAVGFIPIYNDLLPLPAGIALAELPEEPAPPEGELDVRLRLEPTGPARPRQVLRLAVEIQDGSGRPVDAWASVSITDEGLFGKSVLNGLTQFAGPPLPSGQRYLPGINRQGFVLDENGQPMSSPLLGALGVDNGQLLFAKSDTGGKFLLNLPEYAGRQRWQFINHPAAGLTVSWPRPSPPPAALPLIYTEGILEYLARSRQRKKIYQLSATLETMLPVAASQHKPPGWEASISYEVQNYERFPDMATFFQEAVPAVRFLPRRDGYAASLYNPASQDYFSAPPLFIIDGKATRDASFAGSLAPASVQRVELLTDPQKLRQFYPAIGAGGVIRITTSLPGLRLPDEQEDDIFSLPGLQAAASFPDTDTDPSRPALRPAIFWHSGLLARAEEGATLSFRHSDDYGEFCIEVVAQSPDGRRGSGRYCYTVER